MSAPKRRKVYGQRAPELVRITYYCTQCGKSLETEVQLGELEGGCCGDHPPGEYCYCPPRAWHVFIDCVNCGAPLEVEVET